MKFNISFGRTASNNGFSLPILATLAIFNIAFTSADVAAEARTSHSALVSEYASFFTPGTVDGRVEAIAIEGDTVFVGGTFTQIQEQLDGEIIDQPYLFAYSKSTGNIIREFDPVLNNEVYALQTTGEGTGIFVGGAFTSINGETNRKGLLKLDNFGDRVQGFVGRPNKRVYTMDRSGDTLYIGGNFDRVNSQDVELLAAIDTQTGALLPKINLDFEGVFSSTRTNGVPSVQDIEVTSDDQIMVIVGQFRTINGISRSRLAVIELGDQAVVSSWNTDVFDVSCPATLFPQYIKALDISPDDSYFITGSTGFRRIGVPACDSILRFDFGDLTNSDVQPTWRSMTGGDSVFEVATSEHAIYTGGHFRWLNNDLSPNGNNPGPGAVPRAGLAALDPLNGLPLLNWQSDRSPRGVGTFSLEVAPEGLYIGDDTDFINGFKLPKLKFMPLSNNVIARPDIPTLPTTAFNVRQGILEAAAFDGTTFDTSMVASPNSWSIARGAMLLGGKLFYADDNGFFWVSIIGEDNTFGPGDPVNLRGLTSSQWDLSNIGGMFFDHERGRVYYTKNYDNRLFWRAFTPENPLFGENEFIAEVQGDILWSDVRGMDIIDGQLYFGRTDGNLYRATVNGVDVVSGTTAVISGPTIDGLQWDHPFLSFSSNGVTLPPATDAEFEFEYAGSENFQSFRKFQFPVVSGEPVNIRVSWESPGAQLNLFLRDESGQLVDSDTNTITGTEKWLSAPAGNGGIYTLAVKIAAGSTAYTVSVNPIEDPPTPLADYVFSSTGSEDVDQWQVFRFDVEAGDLVEADVIWNDPNAVLRIFLRDETNSQVDRDIDEQGSPAQVSAIASSSAQWSLAVRILSGSTNFDVLVNTGNSGSP